MVGLYETVSAGADRLPDSPDPERWPCALGVRPLAAVPPPVAQRFPGQQGPQSGLPERVYDQVAIRRMYAAVAQSSPPPGPRTLEQRVHQLDRADVGEDVLDAVKLLGRDARRAAVVETALELGEWSADEVAARAWYTGRGGQIAHSTPGPERAQLRARHWPSPSATRRRPYELASEQLGTDYRRAAGRAADPQGREGATVDLDALERATARHMEVQDRLSLLLRESGARAEVARMPAAFRKQHEWRRYVVALSALLLERRLVESRDETRV